MGQGSDSAENFGGGVDEYEQERYSDALACGQWIDRQGRHINIDEMSKRHLKNCIRICMNLARQCSFSHDAGIWMDNASVLEGALWDAKDAKPKRAVDKSKTAAKPRGMKAKMKCHCGEEYEAREADLKRGWAKSCSKRCAAIRRDFGRKAGKRIKQSGDNQ